MKEFIDRFNDMLMLLDNKHDRVQYVNLRPLLSNDLDKYRRYWRDEFHSRRGVFKQIAKKLDQIIQG